jgi:hypothetical protein
MAPVGKDNIGGRGVIQPATHEQDSQVPDFNVTVQFIGSAVFNAENGWSDVATEQIGSFPDRALAKNIASFVYGSTGDETYRVLADSIELPSGYVPNIISSAALNAYFDLDSPQPIDTVLTSPRAGQEKEFTEQEADQIRQATLINIDMAYNNVKLATPEEKPAAVEAFDREIKTSIEKLAEITDFTLARKLVDKSQTNDSKNDAQARYDFLVEKHVAAVNSIEGLAEARRLCYTVFSSYWELKTRQAYDIQVLGIMKTLKSESDINTAAILAGSCIGESGPSAAKHIFDSLLTDLIFNAQSVGDMMKVEELQSQLKTYFAKEKIRKWLADH